MFPMSRDDFGFILRGRDADPLLVYVPIQVVYRFLLAIMDRMTEPVGLGTPGSQ